MERVNIRSNTIGYNYPLEFFFFNERRIITLSDVVLNIYEGNIKDNYAIKGEGKIEFKCSKVSILLLY